MCVGIGRDRTAGRLAMLRLDNMLVSCCLMFVYVLPCRDVLNHDEGACRHLVKDRLECTGMRWTVELAAQPFPENPYDARQFALDALITTPEGTALKIPGFYYEPRQSADRGDQESMIRSGPGRFAVRFRPAKPGRYVVRLEAQPGAGLEVELTVRCFM